MSEHNRSEQQPIGERLKVDFAFSLVLIAALLFVTRNGVGDKPRATEDIAYVLCSSDLGVFYDVEWTYESLGAVVHVPRPGRHEANRPSVAIISDASNNTVDVLLRVTIRKGLEDQLDTWRSVGHFIKDITNDKSRFERFGGQDVSDACNEYSEVLALWLEKGMKLDPYDVGISKRLENLHKLLFDRQCNTFYSFDPTLYSGQYRHLHCKLLLCSRIDWLTRDWGDKGKKWTEEFKEKFSYFAKSPTYLGAETAKIFKGDFSLTSDPITVSSAHRGEEEEEKYVQNFGALHSRIANLMSNPNTIASPDKKNLELFSACVANNFGKTQGLSYLMAVELYVLLAPKEETAISIKVSGPGDNQDNDVKLGEQEFKKKYSVKTIMQKSENVPVSISTLEFSADEKSGIVFHELPTN